MSTVLSSTTGIGGVGEDVVGLAVGTVGLAVGLAVVHALPPEDLANAPSLQFKHAVMPDRFANVPVLQFEHAVTPRAPANCPTSHRVQLVPYLAALGRKLPARHAGITQ